jgi:predicted acylesterase/phospholipase RssA
VVTYGRLAGAALFMTLTALMSGCLAMHDRAAVPGTQLDAARVSGYGDIRFWGDEFAAAIEAGIRRQYDQVRDAALAGELGRSTRKADFLAISGGGGDGAFAAGFLTGWTRSGLRPQFEVVTGVSTGALAAPFAFLGPQYDGVLKAVFTKYGDSDLVIDRGIFGFLGSSRYDTAPLKRLIEQYMTDDVLNAIAREYSKGRRLVVQTTNIDAQRPVIWDLSAIAASQQPDRRDLIVRVLLASSAIPAAFPPVRIRVNVNGRTYDELHVDGGVTAQLFFAPPRTLFPLRASGVWRCERPNPLCDPQRQAHTRLQAHRGSCFPTCDPVHRDPDKVPGPIGLARSGSHRSRNQHEDFVYLHTVRIHERCSIGVRPRVHGRALSRRRTDGAVGASLAFRPTAGACFSPMTGKAYVR